MARAAARYADSAIDGSYKCRLCGTRPFQEDGVSFVPDPGDPDEAALTWQTPDFCGNCGDVLNSCYALEKMRGQRLFHVGQTNLSLIKYMESNDEELQTFITRKQSFNAAMINLGSAGPNEKARGHRVILQQIEVNRERTGAYEWMPKKDYIGLHGDPVVGKHGVVLMQRGG